ncbi:MAG: hypothetical protein KF775_06380 [Cyclobacteriaceae bacterium]|nr:hypothetical protein [Cyclobacteriaceae bacterium]
MSFEVKSIPIFDKQVKRLSKKYSSLKLDLKYFANSLEVNPKQGTPLGFGCYKVRLSIASKGKGKSGGARVITHIVISEGVVYLLSIYDKSERSSVSNLEIRELVKSIPR